MYHTICLKYEAKIEAEAGTGTLPKWLLRLQPNTPGGSGSGTLYTQQDVIFIMADHGLDNCPRGSFLFRIQELNKYAYRNQVKYLNLLIVPVLLS